MLRNSGNLGKYVGGYQISLELASSSSSRVFLGESISPDRHNVAIKRLYTIHIALIHEQENFLHEAHLLKQFDHPNILRLLSADIIKGTPYLVSEYAPNGSLYDRLQRIAPDPMSQDEAFTILAQIGQALHYAHQKKRAHGNLKPQNILFDAQGNALLSDFKFASFSSLASDFAAASPIPFSYMPPEQIEGINSKEDDQYALGCIAYEMFTGRKPFTTPSVNQPGTYYKTRTLIPPRKLNPALPQYVEQAILKAMAKGPSQRHKSILEFIKALETPGTLTVPLTPPLARGLGNTPPVLSRPSLWGKPLFPGLKVANAGAMTLAQFTNRGAARLRNTFSSLTGFSSFTQLDKKPVPILPSSGKRPVRRPFLVIASLLLITAITAGIIFAFSPFRTQQGNNLGATSLGTASNIIKTVPSQSRVTPPARATHPPTRNTGGITIPAQPTQPTHVQLTPTQPTLQPSPTAHTPAPTATTRPTSTFAVTPVSFNATNCIRNNGSYLCFATLSLGSAAASSQKWYTYSIGVSTNFSPSSGSIAPGQTINIKLTVFDTCTKAGTFVFVGSTTNVTAAWNC